MKNKNDIYRYIIDVLSKSPQYRSDLISKVISKCALCKAQMNDNTPDSKKNLLRGDIGTIINEMHEVTLIGIDKNGRYYINAEKPVIIRIENCQKEIVTALSEKSHTKAELFQKLSILFGTDKTVSRKDDEMLLSYIYKLLKSMELHGAITYKNGYYALTPKFSARADDVNALLNLKSEFIAKLHSKGGEFLENYFMNLLKKYCEHRKYKIIECSVSGGADDGGIDGIIKLEDHLGFRETIMIQTKNRIELSSETDIRSFYGAVYAKGGTKGIFVTTSDFHNSASDFLDTLDNCSGFNGNKIFAMAKECRYGIKKSGKSFVVDKKIFG